MYETQLKELGLSDNEIKIYLALLEHGILNPTQLAEKTGLHRSYIYDTLDRLLEKGIINTILINNKKNYQAIDPKVLREIFELKFENKLIPGDYSIAVGLAELVPSINWSPYYEIEVIVDYCPGCYQFKVSRNIEKPIWGKVGVPVVIDKYSI